MRDDDGDLGQRLTAYESRLPDADAPDPRAGRPRGWLRLPLIAGALAAAIAVGGVSGLLLQGRQVSPADESTPVPSSTAASGGIEQLPLDTARRACLGDPGLLRAVFRIPDGDSFWTVFPDAGLAPELSEVELPLLVVVYDGTWPGATTGVAGRPPRESPAPGTADVCVETVDGSDAIASASFGVYSDIPLPPSLTVATSATPQSTPPVAESAEPSAAATATSIPSAAADPEVIFTHPLDATFTSIEAIGTSPTGETVVVINTLHVEGIPPTAPTEYSASIYIGGPDVWELVDTGDMFAHVEMQTLLTPPGGPMILHGSPDDFSDGATGSGVWTSGDGRSWTETAQPLPGSGEIAGGERGYVLARVASQATGARSLELFHSTDGLEWEMAFSDHPELKDVLTLSVGAGPEGFVVIGSRSSETVDGPLLPFAVASSDGRGWAVARDQPALPPETTLLRVTPLRNDWVAAGWAPESYGSAISIWHSGNGLEWERAADLQDPEAREYFAFPSHLLELRGRLFLSAAAAVEGVETRPFGVWTSTDGASWQVLDLGPEAADVRAVSAADVCCLLGGRVGVHTGEATLWRWEFDPAP